ncbi:MAG TPA: hypothetical protein ENH52_00240 [Nitrospirae bacterium]|nr:hypothetical protein [Nitrospirota bacterium]
MKKISFSHANEIYSCSSRVKIKEHRIGHDQFRMYYLSLRKFERMLGETIEDVYWKSFLAPLRRYRFEMCAAPLSFNEPPATTLRSINLLSDRLTICKNIFPQFTDEAHSIFEQIKNLLNNKDNPLFDYITSIIESDWNFKVAILVKESRLIPCFEKMLSTSFHKINIIIPMQLRSGLCYQQIVVIGPSRLYKDFDYIFDAPHANNIDIVHYNWIKDKWKQEPVFIGYEKTKGMKTKSGIPVFGDEYIVSDELLPKIEWSQISKGMHEIHSKESSHEEIMARLLLLDWEKAVYLDAEEGSSVLIIDLYDEYTLVKRIKVNQITRNMFILLRTSGGGDYIVPIANRIMGTKAENARMIQKEWKSRLREKVSKSGLLEVSIKLIDLGSEKANEINVRNWMSYRNIKTADYRDFFAIMKFVGLENKAKGYWDVMGMIDIAHRKAGHYIRKLLLRKVQDSDLSELQKLGKLEFELPEMDCGSLMVIRILDMSEESFTVPVSQIAVPFELKNELWQG